MALTTSLRSVSHPSRETEGAADPQVGAAVERVMEATRDLVETRVELMRLEVREKVKQSGRAMGLVGAAAWLLGVAWLALCAAGALALTRVTAGDVAVAIVATANLVLALGFFAAARTARP